MAAGRAMTLAYASPEQILGKPLSTTSDLYSLGVIAFELLTGARPYQPKRGSAAELEELIENTDPPPASRLAAEPAVKKALQGDLDAILNQALKKRPADRYASVADFARDIERHLARQPVQARPVQARPDSRAYRIAKFVDRHRLGVAATAVLVLAVGAGTATSLWQAAQAKQQARIAEAARNELDAVNDLFIEAFTRLTAAAGADPGALSQPRAVLDVLESTLQLQLKRFAKSPVERQAVLSAAAVQMNYAGDFERALVLGRSYLDELKTNGASAEKIIHAHAMLGSTLVRLGRLDEAIETRRAGVAWLAEPDDLRALRVQLVLIADLGGLLGRLGRRDEAGRVLHRGADLAGQKLPVHLAHTEVLRQLALYYLDFDDARALREARRAADMQVARGMASAELRSSALEAFGSALARNGQLAQAQAAQAEAHALELSVFGRADRDVALALGAWAATLARQGEHVRARQMLTDDLKALSGIQESTARVGEVMLRARLLETEWLLGDMTAALALLSGSGTGEPLLQPRDSEPIAVIETRALLDAGRVVEAATRIAGVVEKSAQRGLPTGGWFALGQTQVMVSLAQGDPAQARRQALELLRLHREHRGMASWAAVLSAELAALAAARGGDAAPAAGELNALEAAAPPTAPDAVERAESLLRRGEIRLLAGDRAAAGAAATAALAALERQHAESPRLQRALALRARSG